MNYERFGGRRFILTCSMMIVASVLLWFGKIGDAIWRDVLVATVAVYVAGNTAQKVAAKQSDKPQS